MQCLLLSAAPVTHIYHLLPHLRDFYTQTPTTVTWNLVPLKSTSLVFFFSFSFTDLCLMYLLNAVFSDGYRRLL